MNRYTIYCTPEQTKKALELGAPIEVYNNFDSDDIREANIFYKDKFIELTDGRLIERITAEQMIGWLEEQKGVSFDIYEINNWTFNNIYKNSCDSKASHSYYKSRKEATLAAIDAALKYLSNK